MTQQSSTIQINIKPSHLFIAMSGIMVAMVAMVTILSTSIVKAQTEAITKSSNNQVVQAVPVYSCADTGSSTNGSGKSGKKGGSVAVAGWGSVDGSFNQSSSSVTEINKYISKTQDSFNQTGIFDSNIGNTVASNNNVASNNGNTIASGNNSGNTTNSNNNIGNTTDSNNNNGNTIGSNNGNTTDSNNNNTNNVTNGNNNTVDSIVDSNNDNEGVIIL